MTSLSCTLQFFSPKPILPFIKSSTPKPFSLPSSPISFQSQSHTLPRPIKAHSQTQPPALSPELQKIITLFQSVPNQKFKYLQLLVYAKRLNDYPPQYRTDAYRVRGCVSQVWVRAYPDPNDPSKVRFNADSDSILTKGLAALLVLGLSGERPAAVAAVSPEFVQLLGLKQSLTPSRNNGFLNMLILMQEKATEVGGLSLGRQDEVLEEDSVDFGGNNGGFEKNLESTVVSNANEEVLAVESQDLDKEIGGFDWESASVGSGGRRERIREKLERELSPVELEVEDVSHLYAGHAGVQGNTGGETHFNLKVVSKEFEGKSMVKRYVLVYDLLREELGSGLPTLSIVAKTPLEG